MYAVLSNFFSTSVLRRGGSSSKHQLSQDPPPHPSSPAGRELLYIISEVPEKWQPSPPLQITTTLEDPLHAIPEVSEEDEARSASTSYSTYSPTYVLSFYHHSVSQYLPQTPRPERLSQSLGIPRSTSSGQTTPAGDSALSAPGASRPLSVVPIRRSSLGQITSPSSQKVHPFVASASPYTVRPLLAKPAAVSSSNFITSQTSSSSPFTPIVSPRNAAISNISKPSQNIGQEIGAPGTSHKRTVVKPPTATFIRERSASSPITPTASPRKAMTSSAPKSSQIDENIGQEIELPGTSHSRSLSTIANPPTATFPHDRSSSPTPSFSSSLTQSTSSTVTSALPTTPSPTDDEFQNSSRHPKKQAVSSQPPVTQKQTPARASGGVKSPSLTEIFEFETEASVTELSDGLGESDSEEAVDWYSNEFSGIITLSSPLPMSLPDARRESIYLQPPSTQRPQRGAGKGLPPSPTLGFESLRKSPRSSSRGSQSSPRHKRKYKARPPPRMLIAPDARTEAEKEATQDRGPELAGETVPSSGVKAPASPSKRDHDTPSLPLISPVEPELATGERLDGLKHAHKLRNPPVIPETPMWLMYPEPDTRLRSRWSASTIASAVEEGSSFAKFSKAVRLGFGGSNVPARKKNRVPRKSAANAHARATRAPAAKDRGIPVDSLNAVAESSVQGERLV